LEPGNTRIISLTDGLTVEDVWEKGLPKTPSSDAITRSDTPVGGKTKVKITFS